MNQEPIEYIIRAKMDNFAEEENVFKTQDPFIKNWDGIKSLTGLNSSFKRRSTRMAKYAEITPAYLDSAMATSSGVNGARSKEINPGTVYHNGYGLFDVITPPWNLYELANYYDTSFANHAAIDAKVENIVGLGYDFHPTKSTMFALEGSTDSAAEKARKRIERARIAMREWIETLNDDDSFTKVLKKTWSSYLNKSLKCWCHSDVWLEKYDRNKGNPVRYCSRQEDVSFFRELQGDNKVLVGSSSFLL